MGRAGGSGSRKGFAAKNERKRPRLAVRNSGSSEDDLPLPKPPRRRVAAETIRVCSGLTVTMKHGADESELTSWNREEKRESGRFDVFDFDEYEGLEFDGGSSRNCAVVSSSKNVYFDKGMGRNGVSKKKKLGGSSGGYGQLKSGDSRKAEKCSRLNKQKPVETEGSDSSEEDSGDSDALMKQRSEDAVRRDVIVYSSKAQKRRATISGKDRDKMNSKISKSEDEDSSMKVRSEYAKTPKAKGVKSGSGIEKQKVRENIRNMLVSAGWKIEYKPRRNKDYLDAVYVSPSGTTHWSIVKAYGALQKQLDDEGGVNGGDRSAFLVSDEILSQLTRKTQKKMDRELKEKQNIEEEVESMENDKEETLSSFMKQRARSFKGRIADSGLKGCQNKSAKLSRCTLLVRSLDKGLNSESDGFVPYTGKRTILSWLVDSGVVELGQKLQYMNGRRTRVLQEGWITKDGIRCGCCSKIFTVSKFEIHAGGKLWQPFQNVYLESGVSLLQCQIDAWDRQEESDSVSFHSVDVDSDDPNDDTCGLCGDGGDLICCDGCPSTFHQSCLNIQVLPQGDWHCPNCTCRYCESASEHVSQEHSAAVSELLTCKLCERRFHEPCAKDMDSLAIDSVASDLPFCSQNCRELFEHLQKYLGSKHELEGGFSWSLIRRADPESDLPLVELPQTVECNSKLAIARNIMDECFLPIVDRRTGINIVHNVLYNCGSNFSRINYGGFYTAVLERGDEIISAASLRFHGTQLAEMPFIGTRHLYRYQGMCRRLFSAIESALRSLKVEKLVIPAISELMHTWRVVFGFTPAVDSLKQEMRSLNMLVFPGLDMLQKSLLEQETTEVKGAAIDIEEGKKISSSPRKFDDKVKDIDFDPNSQGGLLSDDHLVNSSSDDKFAESELAQNGDSPSDSSGSSEEVEEKPVSNPPAESSLKPIDNDDMDGSCEEKVGVSCNESTPTLEGSSTEKFEEVAKMNSAQIPIKCIPSSDTSLGALGTTEEKDLNSRDESPHLQSNGEDLMLVNFDSNGQMSRVEGSKSDENMEVKEKSAPASESEGDLPFTADGGISDAK